MFSDEKDDARGIIEQQILPWIRENVAFPDLKLHGPCDRVVLRHINLERKPQGDIRAFPARAEAGGEEDLIDPLAHKIAEAAQGDADDINQGVQSYAIFAYYPSDRGFVPRKNFRVAPSDVEMQRGLEPSEPPTERGLVAQTQRHLEVILRTTTVSNGHLFQTMQAEMRRLAEINEKFTTNQIEFMVLMQDLLDNAHGRRLKERNEEANLAMKESALSKVEALVPVIINRIAGKPIMPEEDRSLMLMANLLENLSEAQQATLYGNLTDTQKIALAEIFSEYEQRKSKWMRREKELVGLGSKNGLPTARSSDDRSPAIDVYSTPSPPQPQPMPLAMPLSERMKLPTRQSEDPKIKQIEADAQAFTTHFRDLLGKPTPGDPK
jgi:hypothetical protein